MSEIINMIRCPLCKKNFIQANDELVCSQCNPRITVDIAIMEILFSIDRLEEIDSIHLKHRYSLLLKLHQKLSHLIDKAREK